MQGAVTLGLSLRDFLTQLKAAGLGSLPGTAAEVLDDAVRAVLCPDKLNTQEWLEVVETGGQGSLVLQQHGVCGCLLLIAAAAAAWSHG